MIAARNLSRCVATACTIIALSVLGAVRADEKAANRDFEIQGEYQAEKPFEGQKHPPGVQVIAMGKGKFHAVGFPAGLPGISNEPRPEGHEVDGELKGAVVTFSQEGQTIGVIENGIYTFKIFDGPPFKKIERKSSTLGAKPPEGAVVLFDGKSADQFIDGKTTEEGLLVPGATSKATFGDCTVHVEFLVPFMPEARDQARGNSGVYLQGRYEVQVLDSFGLNSKDHDCGGIYSVAAPRVNVCYPPGLWQTYDIDFTAAQYQGGKKTQPARLTVRHNGTLIHEGVAVDHATTAAPNAEGPEPGPLYLQDHGNPVRYRNVWVAKRK